MAESKYRYRIPPCPAYDIPAMERWLEDMAARGLHLCHDGFFCGIATFEEGAPRREKFRLEATVTNGGLFSQEYAPDDDAIQLSRQMGWEYRARRGQFHIYSSADPHAPELHTDPQIQAMTIAALGKYLRKSLFHTLLLLALYALFHFGDMVIRGAVVMGTWRVALFALLILWDLLRQVRVLTVLSRYRKQLQNDGVRPHGNDYRKRSWRYLACGALRKGLWVLLICSVLTFMAPFATEENYVRLDAYSHPFPFATVCDLYPGAAVDRMDGFLHSQVFCWSDYLAPENFDFSEYAEVTLEDEAFDCYLVVDYHRTRWEWVAKRLAREYASQAGANPIDQTLAKLFGQEPVELTWIALPDADYCAYYYSGLHTPYLILQKNEIVLHVRLSPFDDGAEIEPAALAEAFLAQIR